MDKKKRWEKEQVLQMNFFFFKGWWIFYIKGVEMEYK
jgi:hypothetical protein